MHLQLRRCCGSQRKAAPGPERNGMRFRQSSRVRSAQSLREAPATMRIRVEPEPERNAVGSRRRSSRGDRQKTSSYSLDQVDISHESIARARVKELLSIAGQDERQADRECCCCHLHRRRRFRCNHASYGYVLCLLRRLRRGSNDVVRLAGSDAKARPKRYVLSPVLKSATSALLCMLQAKLYLLGIILQRLQARRHEFTNAICQSDLPKHYFEGSRSGMHDPAH